jgi:hypothetical protein
VIKLEDWELEMGNWGLGIGDWAQSPIPNPQSPIPNPHLKKLLNFIIINKIMLKILLNEKIIY